MTGVGAVLCKGDLDSGIALDSMGNLLTSRSIVSDAHLMGIEGITLRVTAIGPDIVQRQRVTCNSIDAEGTWPTCVHARQCLEGNLHNLY